jgi:hypothetical protein
MLLPSPRLSCWSLLIHANSNPEERPSAAALRRHGYLELPPSWSFNGNFKDSSCSSQDVSASRPKYPQSPSTQPEAEIQSAADPRVSPTVHDTGTGTSPTSAEQGQSPLPATPPSGFKHEESIWHVAAEHGRRIRFKCDVCTEPFTTSHHLNRHRTCLRRPPCRIDGSFVQCIHTRPKGQWPSAMSARSGSM